MQNYERWSDNSHDHMKSEPIRDASQAVEIPESLPHGVGDKHQHDDGSDDTKPIACPAFGR